MLRDLWRTSTRSGGNGCLVARNVGVVEVKDSKDPHSPILEFRTDRWRQFVAAIRAREFDSGCGN